jgi:hypothetical protein
LSYSISKVALSCLTIELWKEELKRENEGKHGQVEVFAANPGHCKTAFNGFRGTKDPLDGAEIVVRLIMAGRGEWRSGCFLEFEGGVIRESPGRLDHFFSSCKYRNFR